MARTKKTKTRKNSYRRGPVLVPEVPSAQRSALLQLMGLSKEGVSSAKTANANWLLVVERLSSHPKEAAIQESHHLLTTTPFDDKSWCIFKKYPLMVALANERTPLTKEVLTAFIEAYPDVVNDPRSLLAVAACKNSVLCNSIPDIVDIFQRANPHCCGLLRTRTFEFMGFSSALDGSVPQFNDHRGAGHIVNWQDLENHLRENPGEAKIACPIDGGSAALFPLEVALQFQYSPPPLSTVQLLLQLCPEAATIDDSCALMWACSLHLLEDPEVVRVILKANPKMAGVIGQHTVKCHIEEQFGLPLHTAAFFLPCAARVVPDLMEAYPAAISDISSIYRQIPLQVAIRDRRIASVELTKVLLQYGHRHKVGEECGRGQLFFADDDDEDWMAMTHLIEIACMTREDRSAGHAERGFQNACLGFQAAGAFKTNLNVATMWEHPLLQGAIEFAKMQWIVMQILDRHTTQADLTRMDALGRTPLMVAIEMAGSNDYHDPDEINFDSILQRLLDDGQNGSSEAASLPMNVNGIPMLPLHQALSQGVGLEDGSRHIVNAYPEALSIPDPQSKLLPCLLAAVGERGRVENIFGLMIMRPNLIASLCRQNSCG